ncbi:MAG: MFS transporter [Planctomycetota bacterium]
MAPLPTWRRTLITVWSAQLLIMTAFGFALPFVAYYIQDDMGITDQAEVRHWVALFEAAAPLTMMVFTPIWGMLADRYGRKAMLVRANIGGAVVLGGMALAPTVEWLLVFRLGQGMLTGVIAASQTLISTAVPDHKRGLAMGALSTSMFGGVMAGQFLGGLCGDVFGYAACFQISAGLALLAALAVVLFADERFVRPPRAALSIVQRLREGLEALAPVLPVIGLLAGITFVFTLERPVMPLLVQELNDGRLAGTSTRMGTLGSVVCLVGMVGGLAMGRLADRFSPVLLTAIAAVGGCLTCLPLATVDSFAQLLFWRAALMLFVSGLPALYQVWLSRGADASRHGLVFGMTGSIRSLGWFLGPLCGTAIATWTGLRGVFVVKGGLMLLFIPGVVVAAWLMSRSAGRRAL